MEDFTKPFKQELSTTSVATKSTDSKIDLAATPKKGFIKARKNKDNFWNLMFTVGMILGWSITFGFGKQYSTAAFISAWSTILGVPFIVRHFSKITFSDGKFLNREGIELDIPKQVPNGFFLVATTVIAVMLTGAIADSFAKSHPDSIINLIFLPILSIELFFIPVLFFIFKNCPISILFNYQFYKQNARVSQKRSRLHNHSSERSWWSDPMKSDMPGNIFYKRH